jgi:hypothetical protein
LSRRFLIVELTQLHQTGHFQPAVPEDDHVGIGLEALGNFVLIYKAR